MSGFKGLNAFNGEGESVSDQSDPNPVTPGSAETKGRIGNVTEEQKSTRSPLPKRSPGSEEVCDSEPAVDSDRAVDSGGTCEPSPRSSASGTVAPGSPTNVTEARSETGSADAVPRLNRPNRSARWWLAVGAGSVVSLPIGWLLSYAATLPFFLGPFFFALFGLLIGAIIHRTASAGRPYSVLMLALGTLVAVAVCWGTSLVMESRDLPGDMARFAGDHTRYIGDQSIDEFRHSVAAEIRRLFREDYGPGFTLGYVRWIVTSGELAPGQIAGVSVLLSPRQSGFGWLLRVFLCVALLGFGIGSQTLALRLSRDPAVRAIDATDYKPSET